MGVLVLAAPAAPAELRVVALRVGDSEEAARWYADHLGGEVVLREGRRAVDLGAVELRFVTGLPTADKYERGSVDHIAFADADVPGRIARLRGAGVRVVQRPQYSTAADFHYAFIEDPWGGKVEILSDGTEAGFHHVHVYTKQSDEVFAWYRDRLGGVDAGPFRGFEHLRALQFDGILLIVQQDNGERLRVPSPESLIHHLGWSSIPGGRSAEAPDGVLLRRY